MYCIEIVKPKDGVISVFQKSTCSCTKFFKDYKQYTFKNFALNYVSCTLNYTKLYVL